MESDNFMEKIMNIADPLDTILQAIEDLEEEKQKNQIRMVLAANFLHDVPDDMREVFLNRYEEIRQEVVDMGL